MRMRSRGSSGAFTGVVLSSAPAPLSLLVQAPRVASAATASADAAAFRMMISSVRRIVCIRGVVAGAAGYSEGRQNRLVGVIDLSDVHARKRVGIARDHDSGWLVRCVGGTEHERVPGRPARE